MKIKFASLLTLISCLVTFPNNPVLAQQIVPGDNGQVTIVTKEGNRFTIDGGQLSEDGKNLFHTFEKFGLDAQEIATFLSNPRIVNILARINGGNASVINGLIEVVGGNSNLYLINPSGIIFGPNARLNVPADFTATTATGVLFRDGILKAFGNNEYNQLVGDVEGFKFQEGHNGIIVNAGNLEAPRAENLAIIAGTVVNTGTISAPEGNITIAAVKGTNRVRISQEGHLLSLEIELPTDNTGEVVPIRVGDLPELLTGDAETDIDTGLTVGAGDRVFLSNSNTPVNFGDVVINRLEAANALVSAANQLTLRESQLTTSGHLTLSGNIIHIRDSQNTPFRTEVGEDLQITGKQSIDILALSNPETKIITGGDLTLVSDFAVSADAQFVTGGRFSILNSSNQPGDFTSLKDPIISSNGDVVFGDYVGASLKVESTGNIEAGHIYIYTPDEAIPTDSPDPDSAILQENRAVILKAGVEELANSPNVPIEEGGTNFDSTQTNGSGNITVESINTAAPIGSESTETGRVILEAPGNIEITGTIPNIDTRIAIGTFVNNGESGNGGEVTIDSTGGSVKIRRGSINTNSTDGDGGNISITALETISVKNIESFGGGGDSGNITLESTQDSIEAGNISSGVGDNGGNITIDAENDIKLGSLNSPSSSENGGQVELTTTNGDITTKDINTGGTIIDSGGYVDLRNYVGASLKVESTGNIEADDIYVYTPSLDRDSGILRDNRAVILRAGETNNSGKITVESINTAAPIGSESTETGRVILEAPGNIEITGTIPNIDTPIAIGTFVNTDESSTGNGGDVNINSTNGRVKIRQGSINTSTPDGNAGNISITASESISVKNIESFSQNNGDGGQVEITTANGTINIQEEINTGGTIINSGGDVVFGNYVGASLKVESTGNIEADHIYVYTPDEAIPTNSGDEDSGILRDNRAVILRAGETNDSGKITVESINTAAPIGSESTETGRVILKAPGNIQITGTIPNIDTPIAIGTFVNTGESGNGGNVNIDSTGGSVNISSQGSINTSTPDGNAGNISITASETISVKNIESFSQNNGHGGQVEITTANGTITTQDINTSGTTGGNITIDANNNNITLGSINSSGSSGNGGQVEITIGTTGGDVTIEAENNIQTANTNNINLGSIDSSSSLGSGGQVTITTANGTITTGNIDTSGTTRGGNITLDGKNNVQTGYINAEGGDARVIINTEQFFLGNSKFGAQNGKEATISTLGGEKDKIEITQAGDEDTPFVIGEDVSVNGTQGGIFSSETEFQGQKFPFTRTKNNVSIISTQDTSQEEEIDRSDEDAEANLSNIDVNSFQSEVRTVNLTQARNILIDIEQAIGKKPALIYVSFTPSQINNQDTERRFNDLESQLTSEFSNSLQSENQESSIGLSAPPNDSDYLDILIVTSEGKPIRITVEDVTRKQIIDLAQEFSNQISLPPGLREDEDYLSKSQQLYQWLIAPLEPYLEERTIDNLVFILPESLRLLPMAALHDGQQFLVEKYSSGLAPSISLNDTSYTPIQEQELLLMGASQFQDPEAIGPLDAVQAELPLIAQIWGDDQRYFLNQDFTVNQLLSSRDANAYGIVHLATHADFAPDNLQASYIQFYDDRLSIEDVQKLSLDIPQVNLLVLSACNTAFGDRQVELGFAGLAVKTGVKSVLASLWSVGDVGTLVLMSEFYQNLRNDLIKAQALQEAQINMIKETARIEDGKIVIGENSIPLPTSVQFDDQTFSDPYYWAAFTLIGSPW